MKKVVILLVIFMAVTGAMFAQSAESIWAAIPAASFVKSDDGAVWTFSPTGLTIRDKSGSITIPLRDLKDLATAADGPAVGCSFAYDTAAYKRTYRIIVNAMTSVITLAINRDGVALPVANLTKQ